MLDGDHECVYSGGMVAPMIPLAEARRRCLEGLVPLATERVALAEALGRRLSTALYSAWPLPVRDHAAMDGYGLRSADTRVASPGAPLSLVIVGVAAPGGEMPRPIGTGEAVRILTGAPIPEGVDCVVRQEDVQVEGDRGERAASVGVAGSAGPAASLLTLRAPVPVGADIRTRGGDVGEGVELVPAGRRVDPEVTLALASFGCDPVAVYRRARVVIVSTGDELVPVARASPGQVVDVAGPALAAACRSAGAEPTCLGPAGDTRESLRATLEAALALGPDLLVTVGGASEGDRDLVRPVLAELGVDWLFSRVAVKPGKPTAFGHLAGLPVFALPGNPGAALVVFRELVSPVIERLQGESGDPELASLTTAAATLGLSIEPDRSRGTVLQVEVGRCPEAGGALLVTAARGKSASRVLPILRANASMFVPAGDEPLPTGTAVEVRLRRAPLRLPPRPVLAFMGASNSGKTTVLERLIARLVGRQPGMRIGVVKHGRHFHFDRPGKDSDRYRVAGAVAVALSSPALTATLEHLGDDVDDVNGGPQAEPPSFAELRQRLPPDLDMVLVEGFKREGLPTVEVHRDGRAMLCRGEGFEHVIAVVSDSGELVPRGLPCFGHADLEGIEAFVRAHFGLG